MKYQRRTPWIPIVSILGSLLIFSAVLFFFLLRPQQPSPIYFCQTVSEQSVLTGLDLNSDMHQQDSRTFSLHIPVTHVEEVDQLLASVAENWSNEFSENYDSGDLQVVPVVTRLNEDIASVRLTRTIRFEGSTEIEDYTATVDLKQGKVLSLSDFFKPNSNYLEVLSDRCYRRLKAWQEDFDLNNEQVRKLTLPEEQNFQKFVLDGESLILYFSPEGGNAAIPVQLPLQDLEEISLISTSNWEDQNSTEDISSDYFPEETVPSSSEPADEEGNKQVALTFDDGPHPEYTTAVLDILSEYDARATFFVTGCRVPYYPDLIQRMVQEGHAVGNHTYTHCQLSNLTPQEMSEQLTKANDAIVAAGAPQPTLFRPPFDSLSSKVKTISGMAVALSSVQMEVDESLSEEEIASRILEQVTPDCVIELDDLCSKTPGVTRILLEQLSSQGYEFVTADRLYGVS